jgi:hypothetical protein
MYAIAKHYGPDEPFPAGAVVGDPQVIALTVGLASKGDFFRSAKPDLGECSQRRLHCKNLLWDGARQTRHAPWAPTKGPVRTRIEIPRAFHRSRLNRS